MEEVYVPSTWRRLWAHLIDQTCSVVLYLPFVGYAWKIFFSDDPVWMHWGMLLVLLFVPAIYEFAFLLLMQATPGKLFLGLKVVPDRDATQPLHWGQCVLRPLVGRLSLFFSWSIYALAFFRYDRTHLCDWIAETRVVQFKPRPQRADLRPILGLLLIFSHTYEGVTAAGAAIHKMDFKDGKIDIRVFTPDSESMSIDMEDEDSASIESEEV